MDHDVMYLQGQQQQQQQQQQQLIQQHLLQQLLQRQQQPLQQQSQSLLVQTSPHQQQQLQHLQQQQQRPIKRRTNQTPEESQKGIKLCAVCSELAAGKYFGAEVCVPCKTFYLRYAHSGESFVCKGNDNCLITSTQRTCCKRCRFRKCKEAGMERKLRPMNVPLKEGQQKCVVCSDVANGIHFGALTCEGCKKFFRRGMNESHTYVCKASKNCTINPRTRNGCRYCRYQKCLSQKMSREAIQMGRPSKMNVPSIMSTPKKDKSPNPMASLGHPHQQQQHSFQAQPHVLIGQNHSPQGGYYMNHQLNQMQPGGSNDHHQGYMGEIPNMKLDQVASGFSKFVDEIEDHPSKIRYPCDQDGRPMVGYSQGPSSSLNQPLDYMIEDKQENKSFYSNGMNGGTAFSSAISSPWHHGDLNQAGGMRPMRQPDDYCDAKVKVEQENTGLFYYLNHHAGGSGSNNGMQNTFETSIDWSEELAYRQGDVIPDFAQSLHHASGSPSSMTDEIFNNSNNGGSADQHSSVEGQENHLGLFAFEENFAGNFDTLQSLSTFPGHVPLSGNVLDLKLLLPPHHAHQSQNFQDLFGSSGLSMSSQDIQEVLENANKMQSNPFINLDSLESLVKNAESLVQEASSHAIDSKLKWSQTLQEANRQFRSDGANEDLSEDDLSKAETDFHVEGGCFEDGSLYESLADNSCQYWRTLILPKSDTHWMGEYNNACRNIIVPYKNFVGEMTILNQRLSLEFNSWLNIDTKRPRDVSEFVEKNVVPEFTKLSVNYMKAIPGFLHLDPDDQKLLLRLAQSPSRILAASLNWFDQSNGCFMPDFLPWRRLPEHQDPFFARLEQFARKIQKVRLDETEECFLNAVVIISADYPNLKNPDIVKETSMRFLKIFRAYTTMRSIRGSENTRLEFILSYVPELRHIGLLHHMSTTRPNMIAASPSTHHLPSSSLETLQNMLINGVDSRPTVSSTVKDRKSNGSSSI